MKRFAVSVLLALAAPAWAGTAEGLAALRRGHYLAALAELEPAANAGDPRAQHGLGLLHVGGLGVPRNLERGCALFAMAAEQGLAAAQYQLGNCLAQGTGAARVPAAAAVWFEKAIAQGEINALCALGQLYLEGRGVALDPDKGVTLCREAADKGVAEAQGQLGGLYARGYGVPQDFAEAERWWTKAAENGQVESQFQLGLARFKPERVEDANVEPLAWLEKAAMADHEAAQYVLALYYGALGRAYSADDAPGLVSMETAKAYYWCRRYLDGRPEGRYAAELERAMIVSASGLPEPARVELDRWAKDKRSLRFDPATMKRRGSP